MLRVTNSGLFVGSFATMPNTLDGHGYVSDGKEFLQIDVPGAKWTNFTSINDRKAIAGTLGMPGPDGAFDGIWHGFVLSRGQLAAVDAPDSPGTIPYFINDRGIVAGQYYDADWNAHGFVAIPSPQGR